MSDTKMSGDKLSDPILEDAMEAFETAAGSPETDAAYYHRYRLELRSKIAAAIAERDELVEMIAELLRDDPGDEWIDHSGLIEKWRKATDLLVKHGRIVMVDGAYKWSDRR
jgi:hypothetical protein